MGIINISNNHFRFHVGIGTIVEHCIRSETVELMSLLNEVASYLPFEANEKETDFP